MLGRIGEAWRGECGEGVGEGEVDRPKGRVRIRAPRDLEAEGRVLRMGRGQEIVPVIRCVLVNPTKRVLY